MAKTGKPLLRAYLKTLSPADCREQVLELWDRFPAVRDYFMSRLSSEGPEEALKRAKTHIGREFSTEARTPRGDPAVARAVITEFRRSQVRPETNVEILLFYVETALEFAVTFGDDRAARSIARAFEDALALAEDAELIARFRTAIEDLISQYGDVAWGIGDHLREVWLQYEPREETGETGQRA
jgi:hypothetical protein